MINGLKVLVVAPARGGSKGIPLKNLRHVGGVSLVGLVGKVVAGLCEIDRAVVSTDHEDIARVAEQAGLSAPFRRPESLSGDRIADIDVLTHALQSMEAIDSVIYDIIVMLQPTSPLREPKHVRDCIHFLVEGGWDAVWTVSETDSKDHPLKQLTLGQNCEMSYWDDHGSTIVARQQLTPVYHRNGIAYAITRECLLGQKTIKGARTAGLVIEGDHVSIDTEWDLELVEWILKRNSQKNKE